MKCDLLTSLIVLVSFLVVYNVIFYKWLIKNGLSVKNLFPFPDDPIEYYSVNLRFLFANLGKLVLLAFIALSYMISMFTHISLVHVYSETSENRNQNCDLNLIL